MNDRLAPALQIAALCLLVTHGLSAQDQFRQSRNLRYPTQLPRTIYNTAFGDINGDGRLDLLYACDYDGVSVYVNDGRGGFVDETSTRLPRPVQYASYEVDAADMDGDGDLDLVVANDHVFANKILINDGTGRFTDQSAARFPQNGNWTTAQELLDVDGDGDLDVFFLNSLTQPSHLFLNDGRGRFTDASANLPAFAAPYKPDLAHGDLDGDGDLDIVVGVTPVVLENDGTGRFSISRRIAFPQPPAAGPIGLRDFDGDGRLDVFFTVGNRYYLATGPGTYRDVTTTHLPPLSRIPSYPVDVDLDGDLDLCGAYRLLLNDGKGRFTDASSRMANTPLKRAHPLVADFDGDGDDDLASIYDGVLLNFHRQLATPREPVLGQTFDLEYAVRPGYAPTTTMALPALALAPAKAAIPLPSLGHFQLDPGLFLLLPMVPVPAGTGEARVRYTVPAVPAHRGISLVFQALWIDRVGSPRLGNHTVDVVR